MAALCRAAGALGVGVGVCVGMDDARLRRAGKGEGSQGGSGRSRAQGRGGCEDVERGGVGGGLQVYSSQNGGDRGGGGQRFAGGPMCVEKGSRVVEGGCTLRGASLGAWQLVRRAAGGFWPGGLSKSGGRAQRVLQGARALIGGRRACSRLFEGNMAAERAGQRLINQRRPPKPPSALPGQLCLPTVYTPSPQ
ncbi:hypothetical protein T440DRAFT_317932 [Plenodomus tracheiphilus IPT5]|uniref:Uncharacterized protein n=1 Tax=Plenodomus tracheiphilus IPT5 TaxID=1408161 RepID=A0A6A7BCR2_9PLEO|nr:hypothetical protein T440DRAFT_317932 [Plenodomus tracheiphilus IPT5]